MAIWNELQWMCVTLLIGACSESYKYESLLNQPQSNVSSNQHSEYYSERYEYHKWESSTTINRTKTRSGNSTLKIINIIPSNQQNKRGSKDEVVTNVGDGIVFPDAVPSARNKFAPTVTAECKQGETLCLSVPNYPENYINSLLSNSAEQWHASVDQLIQEPVKINQRIGEDPDTFELCSFKETVAYPKAAQNKDNHWFTIINTQSYVQGFRVEVCRQENSGCHPAATFRLGMIASCKQKYVLREMRALNSDGQVITDYFRLPSCCSCVIRYNDDSYRRFHGTYVPTPESGLYYSKSS